MWCYVREEDWSAKELMHKSCPWHWMYCLNPIKEKNRVREKEKVCKSEVRSVQSVQTD